MKTFTLLLFISSALVGTGFVTGDNINITVCDKCRVLPEDANEKETIYLTAKQLKERIVYQPKLIFPPSVNVKVQDAQIVVVDVFINKKGRVVKAVASKGHPALKNNAETAARYSKFTPLSVDGKKKNMCGELIFEWKPEK